MGRLRVKSRKILGVRIYEEITVFCDDQVVLFCLDKGHVFKIRYKEGFVIHDKYIPRPLNKIYPQASQDEISSFLRYVHSMLEDCLV